MTTNAHFMERETESQQWKRLIHLHKAGKWRLVAIETQVCESCFRTHVDVRCTCVTDEKEEPREWTVPCVFYALWTGRKGPRGGWWHPSVPWRWRLDGRRGDAAVRRRLFQGEESALRTTWVREAAGFVLKRRLQMCRLWSEVAAGLSLGETPASGHDSTLNNGEGSASLLEIRGPRNAMRSAKHHNFISVAQRPASWTACAKCSLHAWF